MTAPGPTRVTLLQRLRDRHDEPSWNEFVTAYQPYMLAVLRHFGASHHDAEDLGQEALLKAWKALPDYQHLAGKCKFRTWLCVICRNAMLNQQQKRHNRETREQPEDAGLYSQPEVLALAEQEWRRHIAKTAWELVQPRFAPQVAQCFLLCASGRSSADIGRELGLAESSVRTNRQRVGAALTKEIVRLDSHLGEMGQHED